MTQLEQLKLLYNKYLKWAYGVCDKHPETLLDRWIGCEDCFSDHWKKAEQDRIERQKAKDQAYWKGQAQAIVEELDKRGLVVTHPGYLNPKVLKQVMKPKED